MDSGLALAVVGATGLVGEAVIEVLQERALPITELYPLASERSLGASASWRGRSYPVRELAGFDFARCDLALFCAGASVSGACARTAAAAGCTVIDTSGAFAEDPAVPLVVADVNATALAAVAAGDIVASPAAATVELVVALKPLHDEALLTRLDLATLESASGAGRAALEQLARLSAAALSGRGLPEAHSGAPLLAFECVPQIDALEAGGHSREELRILGETRRLLVAPALRMNVTAVRVPVFYGHAQAVHIDSQRPLSAARARELLENAPGVTLLEAPRLSAGYPTAATEAANRDTVYVGRIREDLAPDRGLNLWIVADNVRKGAAVNCVQIAEILARRLI